MIERLTTRFTGFLSTVWGFMTTNLAVAIGLLVVACLGFSDQAVLVYTLALSIAAITFTGAVLVQNDRDVAAIQAKLDELVLMSSARNEVVGLEHREAAEIRAAREAREAEAGS